MRRIPPGVSRPVTPKLRHFPKEYHEPIKRWLREHPSRKSWLMLAGYLVMVAALLSCYFLMNRRIIQSTGGPGMNGAMAFPALIIFGQFISQAFSMSLVRHKTLRLFEAARSLGLEVDDAAVPKSIVTVWRDSFHPAKGTVDYNWEWVRHRKALVQDRIGKGLMWRYREEMNRRRLRVLVPFFGIVVCMGLFIPMLLLDMPFNIWVKLALAAAAVLLSVSLLVSYFIHEAFRPTWAALNSLGFATCMRCGYDLRAFEGMPCPECGTMPSDEVVWSEAVIGNNETGLPLVPIIIKHPADLSADEAAAAPATQSLRNEP